MKRTISTILTVVLLFCAVVYGAGCEEVSGLPYDTILLGNGRVMNEDFIYKKENMIDCLYKNRDYDPNDPSSRQFIWDTTLPPYRIIRVTEEMLTEEVFEEVPVVDLESKNVLLLLFSMYGSYECYISNLEIKDDILKITIKSRNKGSAAPTLVCGVIQFDKLEFSNSELIFTKYWQYDK